MSSTGSFIPKNVTDRPTVRRRRVYILSYVVNTLFVGVLLVVGGFAVWSWQLNAALATEQERLNAERDQFQQSDLVRINEIDRQLDIAMRILDLQPAVTALFQALEESTVTAVQITDFSLEQDAADPSQLIIKYTGRTSSFDAVMSQRTTLMNNPVFADARVISIEYGTVETESAASSAEQISIGFAVSLTLPVSGLTLDTPSRSGSVPDSAQPSLDTSAPAETGATATATSSNTTTGSNQSAS